MDTNHARASDIAREVTGSDGTDGGAGGVQREIVPVGSQSAELHGVGGVSTGGGGVVNGDGSGHDVPVSTIHLHREICGDVGRLIGGRDIH